MAPAERIPAPVPLMVKKRSRTRTNQEAKPLLATYGSRRDPRIESEQIGDWTHIARAATWANGWFVLRQNQQVCTWVRSDRNADGTEHSCQDGIQEEV